MPEPKTPSIFAIAFLCLGLTVGCQDSDEIDRPEPVGAAPAPRTPDESGKATHARESRDAFALHGRVTGLQLTVRNRPSPDGDVVGWLRIGDRLRVGPMAGRTSTCQSGWHPVEPTGFVCAGQGLDTGTTPPEGDDSTPPSRENPLPYGYWFVKEPMTPEYHRMPSRNEQRDASRFSERYLELLEQDETELAAQLLAGELEDEPSKPAVVHRYLDRGFYVAAVGTATRASRRFVRTVRGRFVKASRLASRSGSEFQGIDLDDNVALPVAWSVREASLRRRVEFEGATRFPIDRTLTPFPRHTRIDQWIRTENIEGETMHVVETESGLRYVRPWFLAVAKPIPRPSAVEADEAWIHVNLDQQTLVLYRGDQPRFATLVSTGQEGHETPTGLFTIHTKYVADTMAAIGDGNEDRYSIEDVPWAQYFDRSFALHGAFWHNRFGLPRSHGCVNLAPIDARRIFDPLWPRVPDGWLGVTVNGNDRTSHVLVTED